MVNCGVHTQEYKANITRALMPDATVYNEICITWWQCVYQEKTKKDNSLKHGVTFDRYR